MTMTLRRCGLGMALAAAFVVAACTPGPGAGGKPSQSLSGVHRTPPKLAGVLWRPAPTLAAGAPAAYTARVSRSVWALWLDPTRLQFRYIPGAEEPAGGPRSPSDSQPATWLERICAAFNGGFKMDARAGGYIYRGTQVAPLQPGLATMVFTGRGGLRLGVWGRDLTKATGAVAVRQNLRPIVERGKAMAKATDPEREWGVAINHNVVTNRSALARLRDGTLLFAQADHLAPDRFAAELVRLGAVVAVQLDINGSWPVAVTYEHRDSQVLGTFLRPDPLRSASLFNRPYRRDFIAAMVPARLWRAGH